MSYKVTLASDKEILTQLFYDLIYIDLLRIVGRGVPHRLIKGKIIGLQVRNTKPISTRPFWKIKSNAIKAYVQSG